MGIGNHCYPMQPEHKWDLVDAVSRSPLLGPPIIRPGIDLADGRASLLAADGFPAVGARAADRARSGSWPRCTARLGGY